MNLLGKLFRKAKVDFDDLFKRGAIIIDVRTKQEFANGHGQDSRNIPLQEIDSKIKAIKNLDKPIITCCASGARSGSATRILKGAGIDAYNGGSWQNVETERAKQ